MALRWIERGVLGLLGGALVALGVLGSRNVLIGGQYLVRNVDGDGDWYVVERAGHVEEAFGLRYFSQQDSLLVMEMDYRWINGRRHERYTNVVYGPDWGVRRIESHEAWGIDSTVVLGTRRGNDVSLTLVHGKQRQTVKLRGDEHLVVGRTFWPRSAVAGVLTEGGDENMVQLDLAQFHVREVELKVGSRVPCSPGSNKSVGCYSVQYVTGADTALGVVDVNGLPVNLEHGTLLVRRGDINRIAHWVSKGVWDTKTGDQPGDGK